MVYVYLVILLLANSVWLMLVPFTLPGNWLMIISTCLFAWWKWDEGIFCLPLLISITVLALIAELIEFFAGAGGAKKAGASWMGALAAIVGAVIGALGGTFVIPMPILGTMLGACLGAGLCTWGAERVILKNERQMSVRSGIGAGTGVLIGTVSKFLIGCVIWICIAVAAFWP
ncbi:MAG: DUF456 domain-containing protein [Planctomycetota bacterium]|jgi:uncharacterized protein YqgC (DUF456 family)